MKESVLRNFFFFFSNCNSSNILSSKKIFKLAISIKNNRKSQELTNSVKILRDGVLQKLGVV